MTVFKKHRRVRAAHEFVSQYSGITIAKGTQGIIHHVYEVDETEHPDCLALDIAFTDHYIGRVYSSQLELTLPERAQDFAHAAHDAIAQKRKYTERPYWIHTDEVAALTRRYLPGDDLAEAAAHLHDVLEDVATIKPEFGVDEITLLFGSETAKIVRMLTDVYTSEAYPACNRAQRKSREVNRWKTHAQHEYGWTVDDATRTPWVHRAQTIKCCDLISNTRSIVVHDPKFARVYLKEKAGLLAVLEHAVPEAKFMACSVRETATALLEAEITIESDNDPKIQLLQTTNANGRFVMARVRDNLPQIVSLAKQYGVTAILISPNVACLDPLERDGWPDTAFALRMKPERWRKIFKFLVAVENLTGINATTYELDGEKHHLLQLKLEKPYLDEIGTPSGE